jgi:hypothetical protein
MWKGERDGPSPNSLDDTHPQGESHMFDCLLHCSLEDVEFLSIYEELRERDKFDTFNRKEGPVEWGDVKKVPLCKFDILEYEEARCNRDEKFRYIRGEIKKNVPGQKIAQNQGDVNVIVVVPNQEADDCGHFYATNDATGYYALVYLKWDDGMVGTRLNFGRGIGNDALPLMLEPKHLAPYINDREARKELLLNTSHL